MLIPFLRATAVATLLTLASGCAVVRAASNPVAADDRHEALRCLPLTALTQIIPEQRAVADAIMKGPCATVGSPAATPGATSISSPLNVWKRRLEPADRLEAGGDEDNAGPDCEP